jgi:hypothetical protein
MAIKNSKRHIPKSKSSLTLFSKLVDRLRREARGQTNTLYYFDRTLFLLVCVFAILLFIASVVETYYNNAWVKNICALNTIKI